MFSRADISVLFFIPAGAGACFISAMAGMALFWAPVPLLTQVAGLLFFPLFLIALVQRVWTSLPLWGSSLAFAVLCGIDIMHGTLNKSGFEPVLFVLSVCALTEVGRLIQGNAVAVTIKS
jgi:hypothetical protein